MPVLVGSTSRLQVKVHDNVREYGGRNLRTFATETTSESKVFWLALGNNDEKRRYKDGVNTHMVTRLAWMAARLVSSKSETRYASAAS